MKRFWVGLLLVSVLAACGQAQKSEMTGGVEEYADAPAEAPMVAMEQSRAGEGASDSLAPPAPPPPPGAQPSQPPSQPGAPAPVLYLAYSFQTQLELPGDELGGIIDSHINACQGAGPRLCQLVGSNRSGDPESSMSGYVSLRGEPQWLRNFRNGITAQVDTAGGRVTSETTNTEDLTRQIVDTEARQRAQSALRDRLQRLLDNRPGRLADLLEVERELARVQGELDALQSGLAVMRTRVAMSELTLNYQSAPRPLGSDTFEPLAQCVRQLPRYCGERICADPQPDRGPVAIRDRVCSDSLGPAALAPRARGEVFRWGEEGE